MLQQTSVARVVQPWHDFVAAFPTPTACADASLASVLQHWAGLGYHRRARNLHLSAVAIRDTYAGVVPSRVEDLLTLPGVGTYTAHAVASFGYGVHVAVVDTNVGRVLARAISNRRLTPKRARDLADELLPATNAASFNQAMLDLGAQFCRSVPRCSSCPLARDCRWHHEGGDDPALNSAGVTKKQAAFSGSRRQARGQVLRALREGHQTLASLQRVLTTSDFDASDIVKDLERDGLITRSSRRWALAGS